MNKKTFSLIIILIVIAVCGIYFFPHKKPDTKLSLTPIEVKDFDGRNSTFTVEGESVTLTNGISETSIPNSSSKITTRYFGNEATGDLNGDSKPDTVFLITQDTGGSGLFYYAVAAISTSNGFTTTNAFLIGDRIAPQSTVIPENSQEVQVNYADRKANEPMTAQPSQGAVKILKVSSKGVLEGVMQ